MALADFNTLFMPPQENTLSDTDLAGLPNEVRQIVLEAEDACKNANSLFDLGFARGLSAAMQRTKAMDRSTHDRAYKRGFQILSAKRKSEIVGLSPAQQSNLGFGLTVHAAPGTRGERI